MFHINSASALLSCGEGQTTAWSKITSAGYEAPVAFDGGAPGPVTWENDQLFKGTFDELPNVNVEVGDPETTGAADNYNNDLMNADLLAAWVSPTPPLTDAETITLTPSEATWDENVMLHPQPVAESLSDPFARTSALVAITSYDKLAYIFEKIPIDGLTPPYSDDDGGIIRPHFGPTSWRSAEYGAPPLGTADVSAKQSIFPATYTQASLRTVLGKHPRVEDTSDNSIDVGNNGKTCTGSSPRSVKRRMGVNAGFTSRAGTRTLIRNSSKFEAVGCGAGMLAAPSTHQMYHHPLPGPSVQGLMGNTARGERPRIEGSEVELTLHHTSSVGQQQDSAKDRERGDGRFRIPTRLSQRHRELLRAKSDDWERGTIGMLKCRLCPDAAFANWEDYKRHCNFSEAHPIEIHFCNYCGDFFARTDSLKRHKMSRPPECLSTTPTEADVKRQATNKAHETFKNKLEGFLKGEEEVGTPFGQIIKDLLPSTSKRGSRQQSRLKAPRAESG